MENEFCSVVNRLRQEAGIKTQKQLAEILGIKPPAISEMKKSGKFSKRWAYILESKLNLNPDWIMTGQGSKILENIEKYGNLRILNEVGEWLAEEIRKNPKREEWFELQMLDSFPSFKRWKEEKEREAEIRVDTSIQKVA